MAALKSVQFLLSRFLSFLVVNCQRFGFGEWQVISESLMLRDK
jgi:hypothetical protein